MLFLTSPAYGALAPELARHGLAFCHAAHPTAVLRPDGSALVLSMDQAANIAAFNALAAGDGDRHGADVGSVARDAPVIFALLGGPLWSWPTLKLGQARRRGLWGLAAWFGGALMPARGWLKSYESPLVQAPWALRTGRTPEATYSGQMGMVIAFALEAVGAPVVKGRSGAAVAAFRALIEERGGEIRCGVDVDRVLVENGRARGVVTAEGEEIAARDVIASVAPRQLYQRLLREVNLPGDRAAAKTYRHGRGNFQLHYALKKPPVWKAKGLEDVALIHLTEGIDSVSKSANEAERGVLPEVPTSCEGQPSQLDPSRAPEGKAALWLQIPDAPRVIKGDAGGDIATTPEWSEAVREAFANRIEAILASHIKDFAKIKRARRAYSPADLAALNINLVGGDPFGGACTIDQFFLWRPFARSVNGTTSMRGLHQIGASTHRCPGSGYALAKRMGA